MNQAVPSYVWTKLHGHDVEAMHQHGATIVLTVDENRIRTQPADVFVWLRAPGGAYPPGWRAPLCGWYQFGAGAGSNRMSSVHRLTFATIVLEDADLEDTDHGPIYTGPGLAMNSDGMLDTKPRPDTIEMQWRSR